MWFSVDNIFTSLKWCIVVIAVVSTIIGLYFPTAEAQAELLGKVGLRFGVTPGSTPELDTPTILTILWVIWIIFILSQTSWKMLKVASDRVIMDGVDRTESCVASELHPKGDLGFIEVGGIKLVPYLKGKSVWINPLTHVHKVENTVWMEAHAAPNTGLEGVPPELKYDIYQRRAGLFGIDRCTVGYLSSKELQQHTGFDGKEYEDADTNDKKLWTTSTFITDIMAKNKAISVLFDYFGDDTTPIERKLASIKRIGAAANSREKKGLMDWITAGD